MTKTGQSGTAELSTRFAVGLVMAAAALLITYYAEFSALAGWLFRLLVAAIAAVMLIEWSDIHRVPRRWAYTAGALAALLLLGLVELQFPVDEFEPEVAPASFQPLWPVFGAALGAAALLGILSRRWVMFGGFLYIAIPALALLVIEWIWFGLTVWAMIVTWATDIFAFFAGTLIGGPKLAPRISPNKTWSGLAGGVVGAGLVGWPAAILFDLGWPFVWLGAFMAVLAQAGDLYESSVKRRAGVKDSGTLLPGHGGLLDRLDGFLPVLVATLALLMAGYWAG